MIWKNPGVRFQRAIGDPFQLNLPQGGHLLLPSIYRGSFKAQRGGSGCVRTKVIEDLSQVHAAILGEPTEKAIGEPKNSSGTISGMEIGKRIKMLREAAGLSGSELARRIGIKPPSLWEIENGETKTIKAATLMRLSEALNADPAWLSSGRGAPYKMAVSGPDEGELVSIYRNLPADAQNALLGAARGILAAQPRATKADPFKVRTKK